MGTYHHVRFVPVTISAELFRCGVACWTPFLQWTMSDRESRLMARSGPFAGSGFQFVPSKSGRNSVPGPLRMPHSVPGTELPVPS